MQETTGAEHCNWQHWQEMLLALSSTIDSNGKKEPRRLSQRKWKKFYSPVRIPAGGGGFKNGSHIPQSSQDNARTVSTNKAVLHSLISA
jgi:hypothetical protein